MSGKQIVALYRVVIAATANVRVQPLSLVGAGGIDLRIAS